MDHPVWIGYILCSQWHFCGLWSSLSKPLTSETSFSAHLWLRAVRRCRRREFRRPTSCRSHKMSVCHFVWMKNGASFTVVVWSRISRTSLALKWKSILFSDYVLHQYPTSQYSTGLAANSGNVWTTEKCHCKRVSLYPMIFSLKRFFSGPKTCHCCQSVIHSNRCHCRPVFSKKKTLI